VLQVAKEFPSYFDIGRGCGNFLCYGVFLMDDAGNKFIKPGTLIDGKWEPLDPSRIIEDVACSRFSSASGLHPSQGETQPSAAKSGAYSWIKAPRYRGCVMEVGALARILVNYHDPNGSWVKNEVDNLLSAQKIPIEKLTSVLGRHVARGLETLWVARQAMKWLDEIVPDGPPARDFSIPRVASGYGLTEAPRGALGHWLSIEDYKIKRYQCVVPTTWNCSPKDDKGQPGPVEQAITGTVVEKSSQPIEIGRIVRSFDPCIACAVH
jgi:Ni,Fe-hydrogenase I large subunit